MYFNTRELSAVSLSAAMWAVLNLTVTPIFWDLTHLPILCDMIGVSLLILTVMWTKKPGGATTMGALATILNFVMRPSAVHFLGFTVASVVFDLFTYLVGYDRCLEQSLRGWTLILGASLLSTGVAGGIIGAFFYAFFLYISRVFVGVWIGRKVLGFFKKTWSQSFFWPLVLGTLVVSFLSAIPFLGWLFWFFFVLLGAGATAQAVLSEHHRQRSGPPPDVPAAIS